MASPITTELDPLALEQQVCFALAITNRAVLSIYRPLLERSNYVEGESRRLVDRLFGGRAAPLLAHLAEAEALSDEDIAEIEALLKGLKQ